MSRIPFKMIEFVLSSGQTITLDDIIKNTKNFPMYLYSGEQYTKSNVLNCISYLETLGGGKNLLQFLKTEF